MLRTLFLSEFLGDVQKITGESVELCLVEMSPEEKRSVEGSAKAGKAGESTIITIERRAMVFVDGQRHQKFDDLLNR
jgi:hypothetical protein